MTIASRGWRHRFAPVAATLGLLAGLSTSGAAPVTQTLTPQGLGQVRIGMSWHQAERALGVKLTGEGASATAACWYAERSDGVDPGVAYMVDKGRITRIDIGQPSKGASPSTVTAGGIGLGADVEAIRRAYGADIRLEAAEIEPDTRLVRVETSKGRGTVLEIHDGKVTAFRSGLKPAIDYSEGCS